MSRILRRPMFRGGRVDGRGTGIASGLGYAKGGQVQPLLVGQHPDEFKDAEGREQHWNPLAILGGIGSLGMRYGPQAWRGGKNLYKAGKNLFKPKKTFEIGKGWTTTPSRGQKIWQSKWNPLSDPLIGGVGKYTIGAPIKGAHKFAKWSPWGAAGVGGAGYAFKDELKDLWDEFWPWADEKPGGREFVGDELEIVGDPRKPLPDAKKEKSLEEIMKEMMGPEKSSKEKIEEYKEIFKDAYGSGRVDDASTMALSFAGKALKPEATVKSAFSEFFEEESKRPSESKKYKDAATTAAINAYLTGESSFQKFEDQLKLAKAGMDIKLEAGRPKTLNEAFTYFMKTGDDATDPGIMARSVEAIYGDNTFGGKFPEDRTKLIIGNVYYADDPNNSSNKILFLIDENREPQPIKTVYK